MLPSVVLEELSSARRIADYAESLGVRGSPVTSRAASEHLGAVLADAILQSGVSYRSVVRVRVDRILSQFPEASTLPGLVMLLHRLGVAEFLLWRHPVKIARFNALTQLLADNNVGTVSELRLWISRDNTRERLLSLHGIGPKTYDYLCCLVGVDCIAVDRHVRRFANEAGVFIRDYAKLKSIVSYAADLLGMARRDFDAWIWRARNKRAVTDGRKAS